MLTALCLLATALVQQSKPDAGKLEVRVDPRVELVSIVFRLAGHREYNMPVSKSPYADDVERQFGGFRDHAAVKMARELRGKSGISYDAVMSLAVHLDDALPPGPRTPLEPRPAKLEGRWKVEDAEKFIAALGDFVRDTDFKAFIAANRERYEKSAERLSAVVNKRDYVGWFDKFFGTRPNARFCVIVGMLEGGGNYGVSMRYADGREEITPVIGIYKWDDAGLPAIGDEVVPTIVHEFCHSYTNTFVDQNADKLQRAGEKLFPEVAATMKRQAYSNWKTMMYESLVRAVVAHHMQTQDGPAAGRREIRSDQSRGFKWSAELAALLAEYAGDRDKYKAFGDFMPRVVAFFDQTAENYAALLAKFPKVVSIDPANGAKDVDPALEKIVITFDQPMQDKSWSLVGGGPECPKFGAPSYGADRKVLTVPVRLEPGKRYRFGLNGGNFLSFAGENGYPLEPVEVTFATRDQ